MDPVLAVENVSLVRDDICILDDISLEIHAATRLLIQGPSGAGKSSLFQVLGLLEPPTSGTVRVDGTDASTLSERDRARLRRDTIGVIFQDFQLIPDLTARENAAVPQAHAGKQDDEWLDTLFDAFDIGDLTDVFPASLSGGEKQRVAATRALANRPAVVLADEPTGQLDPETAAQLLDLLCDLQTETNMTLVVVSHDRSIADRFSKTIQLQNGSIVDRQ